MNPILRFNLTAGDRRVPWMGELPTTWQFTPLKYVCQLNGRTLEENTDPRLSIRYIDISSVTSEGAVTDTAELSFEDAPSRARRIIVHHDVFVSTVRTYLTAIAYCDEALDGHVCSTGFAVLTPGADVHPRFLFYWARGSHFVGEVVARSTGVSYPAINASELGNLPFPLIPYKTQCDIAMFLDRRTEAIDTLLAKKQRQIELLAEKRQALISHAVANGLDPDVRMKDSGIDWLEKIPAHWGVTGLKRTARRGYRTFIDGDWIEAPYITDEGVRLIQTGNIGTGYYKEQGFRYVSHDTFGELNCTSVEPGDVLICRLDGPVGRACVAPDLGCKMITSVDVTILKPAPCHDARFLVHLLSLRPYLEWVGSLCRVGGGHRFRVSRTMLGDFLVPLPPYQEQVALADWLDHETQRIDRVGDGLTKQIDKLREYRQALISAAVTGKLIVPKGAN